MFAGTGNCHSIRRVVTRLCTHCTGVERCSSRSRRMSEMRCYTPRSRGLHSSTTHLNVSTFCWICSVVLVMTWLRLSRKVDEEYEPLPRSSCSRCPPSRSRCHSSPRTRASSRSCGRRNTFGSRTRCRRSSPNARCTSLRVRPGIERRHVIGERITKVSSGNTHTVCYLGEKCPC